MDKLDFLTLFRKSNDKFDWINEKLHSIATKDPKVFEVVNEVIRSLMDCQILDNDDFKNLFNQ